MTEYPQFSIVIPMFNVEKYIETTINSILLQTFEDFEVVIVDDCSNDRSAEIVRNYSDPRIKLFRQIKNSGEGVARNFGLKVARGQYVFFMDSDDALLPQMFEKFYTAAKESQADVIYMNTYLRANDPEFTLPGKIDVERRIFYNPTPRFLSENLIERLQDEYFSVGVHVVPWMKIQRRDFLLENQIHFPQTFRNSDVLFNFAELCLGRKIQVIDAQGYIYRSHIDSVMGNISSEKNLRAAVFSMPSALEFVREFLESPNLISPLDESFKMKIETEVITRLMKLFVLDAYDDRMTAEQINTLLCELMFNTKMFSPEFVRVLFNTLSLEMLENERLRGENP